MPAAAENTFLISLGQFVGFATWIYVALIFVRVLLTWINPNPYTPFMQFLSKAVDPALNLGRRYFRLTFGGIDFSPILVIILVQLSGVVIGQWLMSLGRGAPITIIFPLLALAIIGLLDSITWMLLIVMVARVIMSLVNPSPYNFLVRIVYGLSEPLLAPLRRFFPVGPGGLDIRALVFLLILILIRQVLLSSLTLAVAGWLG